MGHQLAQHLSSGKYCLYYRDSALTLPFIDESSTEEVEAQLHDVNSRWRDLRLLLEERKRRLQIAVEAERFQHDLQQIDAVRYLIIDKIKK